MSAMGDGRIVVVFDGALGMPTMAQRVMVLLGMNGENWCSQGWGTDTTYCVMRAFWLCSGRAVYMGPAHQRIREAARRTFGNEQVAYCNDHLANGDFSRILDLLKELHEIERAHRAKEGGWVTTTSLFPSSSQTPSEDCQTGTGG